MTSRFAIVLAAGKGTRMRSSRSKVVHEVGGRPSLQWVIDGARRCGCAPIVLVVGPEADDLRTLLDGQDDVRFVVQEERRGTGHAVQVATRALEHGDLVGTALVLYADAPLVREGTLERLLSTAEAGFGSLSVADLDEPGNLGRVDCARDGQLRRIVEVADATPEDLAMRRVNAGHYALRFPDIVPHLDALEPANEQGELYLTDAVVAAARDAPMRCVELEDPSEAWGINTRADLARVHEAFCRRSVAAAQDRGVTFLRPDTVTVDATVEFSRDVVIHPGVHLLGATRIGEGTVVHAGSWLRDAEIGANCEVRPYSVIDQSTLAAGCGVGPFVRLRGGAELAEGVQLGNFVEVKKSSLGAGVKAAHLAYLGDATVGEGSNIGAGVVTCNYDGERKHQTTIGAHAFVGSDSMLVAPVEVGDGATTAAGSVITQNVPDKALAVGRARQRNIENWRQRRRSKSEE